MPEEQPEIIEAHCNNCLNETNHLVVAKREKSDSESIDPSNPYEDIYISWSTTYTMLECRGCEHVCLKREFYFSEADGTEVEFYPPKVSRHLPKWHVELPDEMSELLMEVYTALHANSRRLALMGARTLVDLYLNAKIGDIGGFAQKMTELESQGLISKPNKEHLDAALEAGHAAAHRGR
jgi:hypothetical protein